jgi:DNA-binding XRE family transcriptional regulator
MSYAYVTSSYMPRKNPHPSTVATLRKTIGQHREWPCTQDDLAQRVGVARITIQSIERGVLALSEQTARRIAEVTGAGAEWLLRGKPSSQPKDAHGRPLTREIWLAHANDLPKRHGAPGQRHSRQARHRAAVNLSAFLPPLASVAASAAKSQRLDLFAADLREAVAKLAACYGKDESTLATTADVLTQSIAVRIMEPEFPAKLSEPGFPLSVPADRLCNVRYFSFDKGALQEVKEMELNRAMNHPLVLGCTVEVKPSATAEEIRTMYPRPKAKAAKKVAKRRKSAA